MVAQVLTLATSVLNGMPHIVDMLASVSTARQIEHIAVDAGSTDGTLEVLREHKGLRLVERPRISLYGAWNVALKEARGAYIAFLNADDELAPDAVSSILDALGDNPDIVCGSAEVFEERAGGRRTVCDYRGEFLTGVSVPVLAFGAPIINAKVFRCGIIESIGGFDESYSIAADRDLLWRLV